MVHRSIDQSNEHKLSAFDGSILGSETNIPSQFIWPDHEKPCLNASELVIPMIDMRVLVSGDDSPALSKAVNEVNEACKKHGFFQVVNHGVDSKLIEEVHRCMEWFFGLQLAEKQKALRKVGESYGYAGSFVGRFSSKLPWKETLSFRYCPNTSDIVEQYMVNALGEDFRDFGRIYQKYCEAMNKLSMEIMELLGISLGLEKSYFKDFFADNDSILRLNHYPKCQQSDLTLGTGPHSDPTSLTILHQDQVGGLQVLADGEWQSVAPVAGSFVVNLGDTFMALSNGIYKSCLHRAVVNPENERKSIAFFLSPKMEKPVNPSPSLVNASNPRRYPEFSWSKLLGFTQLHYRSDMETLDAFSLWVQEQESNDAGLVGVKNK